jgi:uncharacterized protein YbaR (Trm112 family)
MNNLSQINKIKELYDQGGNLMEFLRGANNGMNDPEAIMISYDFQAGSYIQFAKENKDYLDKYSSSISKVINQLGSFSSILEVGVGEATVMTPLMHKLLSKHSDLQMFGFDISWSRVYYAKKYSIENNLSINLFTGNLFNIPLPDNSIDIVYTSHSLEPNGGKEKEALKELYRVAAKYLVLLEPDYELANDEGRTRMDKHGYIKYIDQHALELNYHITQHRLFDYYNNPLNPTGLTVIKKNTLLKNEPVLICPITKTKLELVKGSLYSPKSLMVFPIIDKIPCLLEENGILAAHFNS